MKESVYQAKIIKKLEKTFPGCVVLKNDPGYRQGIPDLIILYEAKWAMLEVKKSESENIQPNQEHYVSMFGRMSYSSFIFPENEERVFDELQHAFGNSR